MKKKYQKLSMIVTKYEHAKESIQVTDKAIQAHQELLNAYEKIMNMDGEIQGYKNAFMLMRKSSPLDTESEKILRSTDEIFKRICNQ